MLTQQNAQVNDWGMLNRYPTTSTLSSEIFYTLDLIDKTLSLISTAFDMNRRGIKTVNSLTVRSLLTAAESLRFIKLGMNEMLLHPEILNYHTGQSDESVIADLIDLQLQANDQIKSIRELL